MAKLQNPQSAMHGPVTTPIWTPTEQHPPFTSLDMRSADDRTRASSAEPSGQSMSLTTSPSASLLPLTALATMSETSSEAPVASV